MKLAILGDTHFGMRSDSVAFQDYAEHFYSTVFFPYLVEHGIKTIIQVGDFFDRRKYINFLTYKKTLDCFIKRLEEFDIQLLVFVGNHDTYFKNTNDVNSVDLLLRRFPNVQIIDKPSVVFDKICLIPWIADDTYYDTLDFINNTKASICMGHFDIVGFSMYKGMPSQEGLDRSVFDKFDLTLSGHYHHRSKQGNIVYVGTPMQITWQDYNDPKGFHILDTNTLQLDFIENPYEMFHQIIYDDKNLSIAQINEIDVAPYKNTYVKVIVDNKTNPYLFDKFLGRLYDADPIDVTIAEDFTEVGTEEDDDMVDQAEDTLTIINKFIDTNTSEDINTSKLKVMLREMYNEAMNRDNL